MDLLGDYGDDDDSEQEEEPTEQSENTAPKTAAPTQGLSTLVGYLQAGDDDDDDNAEKDTNPASNRPRASVEPSPSPTLSSKGVLGSWGKDRTDGTPTFKPRNAALRIISKSTTPLANSPQVPADVPSDASCPGSPHLASADASVGMAAGTSISSLPDVKLPPAPEGDIDPKIAQNVAKFAHLRMHKNATVNAELYDKKEFHNPGILEFLVTTYNIKETGSNYPKQLFDPGSYAQLRPSLFFDHLRRSAETARQQDVKASKGAIEFVGGTTQVGGIAARPLVQHVTVPSAAAVPPACSGPAAAAAAGADGEKPRKRSKWDQATKPLVGAALPGAALAGAASTGIAINDFKRLQQMAP